VNTVKIGVVGVGNMGLNHCRVLQNMKQADFIGVFDINMEKCKQVAEQYQVAAFSSYDELLKHVDAVVIAAPTTFHFQLTEQAILNGKHVLVEKPFVTSLKEAIQIIKMLQRSKVILQVGHVERFNPAVELSRRIMKPKNVIFIESRRLGASERNLDVDVVLDLMIHDIDILLDFVKSPIKQISSVGYCLVHNGQPDIACALISFRNGIIANLVASRISQEKVRTLTITEKKRIIKADYLTKELFVYLKTKSSFLQNSSYRQEFILEKIMVPHVQALLVEIEHFIKSIQSSQPPIVGAHEGTNALEIALKIKKCIKIHNRGGSQT
jgi:predicted dehydrogenase